jgi:hypothetical protein
MNNFIDLRREAADTELNSTNNNVSIINNDRSNNEASANLIAGNVLSSGERRSPIFRIY